MKIIRHEEISRDSLFKDIEENLETIYALWTDGNVGLRFSVPILCAAKLEAFINIAGKLKIEHWDILERKLSFPEKCKVVFSVAGCVFAPHDEPNKTAISTFDIRNSLVHPKMKLCRIDEQVSQAEYERRRSVTFNMPSHHLRSELNKTMVEQLKYRCDEFVSLWGDKLLDGEAEHWLSVGSTGGFTFEPTTKNQLDESNLPPSQTSDSK